MNDETYYNYNDVDGRLIEKSKNYLDIQISQRWLSENRIDIKYPILWDKAIITPHTSKGPVIINIPIERDNDKTLQRLIFTYNNKEEIIESQLWTFTSKNGFLSDYSKSYTMKTHEIVENFTGDIIKWDINTNLLQVTKDFDYKTNVEAKMIAACNRCHSSSGSLYPDVSPGDGGGGDWWSGGPIELDVIIINGPGDGGSDWQFEDTINWNPVWGGGVIPVYATGTWDYNPQ